MMKGFSFRVSEELIKEADKLARLQKIERSFLIREVLEKGLAQVKLEIAVKFFSEGKFSVGEASELAEVSVGEFMELLRERGIDSGVHLSDLRENMHLALKYL